MYKLKFLILILAFCLNVFYFSELSCSEKNMKADLILEFDELDLYKFIDPDQYDISSEIFFVEKAETDTLFGIFFSSNERIKDKHCLIHFINKNKQLCKTLYAKDFYSVFVYDQKSYILNKDLNIESILYKDSKRDKLIENMKNRLSGVINQNINIKENYKSITDITKELFPDYFLLCNDTALSFIDHNNIYIYDYNKNKIKTINDFKINKIE
jgi:hypothetical protein